MPVGNEARERLVLEKMGHEVELLVEKAQNVEHHGFDCMTGGHNPHFRVRSSVAERYNGFTQEYSV